MKKFLPLYLLVMLCTITVSAQHKQANKFAIKEQGVKKGLSVRISANANHTQSDSIAKTAMLMPTLTVDYYYSNWGIGIETGSFNSNAHLNLSNYLANMRGFTHTTINNNQWKTWFVLVGPSFQKNIGNPSSAWTITADLRGGIVHTTPASFSVIDTGAAQTPIVDYYFNTGKTNFTNNALLAVKPTLRLEWFPKSGPVGIHVQAGYLQVFGAQTLTTYYRDISNVNFNLGGQEIRKQVTTAPIVSTATQRPHQQY